MWFNPTPRTGTKRKFRDRRVRRLGRTNKTLGLQKKQRIWFHFLGRPRSLVYELLRPPVHSVPMRISWTDRIRG
jgi:hypothetical protein